LPDGLKLLAGWAVTQELADPATPYASRSGNEVTAIPDRALQVAMRMCTGSVTINGKTFFGLSSPFGGTKQRTRQAKW
jgi:acyl-CoA reductase-like NAD-dependent aldehyde dehydrogenase